MYRPNSFQKEVKQAEAVEKHFLWRKSIEAFLKLPILLTCDSKPIFRMKMEICLL